jgi:prepilin-type N-terminal cleavage/methylation domain-containing protein
MKLNDEERAPLRRGISLIEVLVVLVIIGLLTGLLLVAVGAARDTARKASCLNNLRQLGIGLLGYDSTFGCFPGAANSHGYSIHVTLLPYIEQRPLFDSINLSILASPGGVENETIGSLQVSLFLCPSDPVSSVVAGGTGWTSYAGNRGSGLQTYGEDGAFSFPPMTTHALSAFRDGASQTVAMSEWIRGEDAFRRGILLRSTFHTPTRLDRPDQLDAFAESCASINVLTARRSFHLKGSDWIRGELGHSLYNHVLEPGRPTCLNGSGYQIGAWTAGSLHPGISNVLFADGASRSFRTSTARAVWRALGSRNGGEVVSSAEVRLE